jgi:2-keto-4-pentenoate hydratase/2-oxohepta-3-ene-1,7-dioic acid hydratase in catechol pathway
LRFTRIRSEDGAGAIAVGRDDKWIALSSVPDYENVTRIREISGVQAQRELAEAIDRQTNEGNLTRLDIDLDAAETIADRDADLWGAGLNYIGHSEDLNAQQPASGPGSYLRPSNCLIGNGGFIELPSASKRVTAEAELGLILGTACKDVARDDWRSVVAGVTAVLDMTAEDVIRENPRYIPWAKGFDTFCSVGPVLVTLDEFSDEALKAMRISTVLNGEVIASAAPSGMKYDLGFLVAYFTAGRTLEAGTLICTGTPGAVPINPGDTVQAIVQDVGTLTHPVR